MVTLIYITSSFNFSKELPFDVIWKIKNEHFKKHYDCSLDNTVSAHKNVKVLISQAGLKQLKRLLRDKFP